MAYLFVAVASVTHVDLLLNSPIKLPLLQIEIPLGSFFLVTPLLLILTHFGVLLHHVILERKAREFTTLLAAEEMGHSRAHGMRLEVSSYFFTQNEAGPERGPVLKMLLEAMSFITLNLLPLLLLIYFQITFLPVHNAIATWLHRVYVALDIVILVLIGLSSLTDWRLKQLRSGFAIKNPVLSITLWPLVLLLSMCVVTLPGGPSDWPDLDYQMTRLWPAKIPFDGNDAQCTRPESDRCAFWLTAFLFEQPIDYVSSRRPGFSRNLVVTEKAVVVRAPGEKEVKLSLRGRDLRYATFDRSDLRGADLTAANLSEASLKGTDLREAVFGCAVRGKKLAEWTDDAGSLVPTWVDDETCPVLTRANLTEAKLSNGSVNRAKLTGAVLAKTDMRGFDLRNVNFSNVSLVNSNLTNSNLAYANLDGAELRYANAQGASFYASNLRGADLTSVRFDASVLSFTNFSGANLSGASMIGATLTRSVFFGANLSNTRVWGTKPPKLKAFALAAISELNLSAPESFELSTIKNTLKTLSSFPVDDNTYAPPPPIDLLEPSKWERSKDQFNWQSLSKQTSKGSKAKKELGTYLADLGCKNNSVLRGILNYHLLSNDLGYYDTSTPIPVLPTGIQETDLIENEISGSASNKPSWKWIRYYENAELVRAFLDRVTKVDCVRKLDEVTIGALAVATNIATRSKESAELQIVLFEH